jgi:hypothetical protein
MLTEEQAAAVGFFFPDSQPLKVDGIHVNNASPDLPGHIPLQVISGPSRALPAIAPPQKRQCSAQGCKRVRAEECGLCKTCCGTHGQGCTSRKHLKGPPRTIRSVPFTPNRPPAILPPLQVTSAPIQLVPITSPSGSVIRDSEMVPRSFREDMPSDWAKEWKDREEEVRKRREAAELRRKNELAMAHQVVIQLWREV